jgi:K+-sensing histidine kinase KdpD
MVQIEAQRMDEAPQSPRLPADEARSGHLGFVAHEIRNPLSTALWTAELLERMDPAERGGARGAKLSAICLRSIARVRQLVEDHLLSERLDVGGLPLRREALGVADALAAVLEKRPPAAPPVTSTLAPAVAVEADRQLLERVLESLVAVAGADGASATVAAHASEHEVTIIIVGGRPADPAALADPIKGAPSDPAGRALAVPLARRIAHALGGALAAGEGGWRLTLPRAASYTARPSPPARP